MTVVFRAIIVSFLYVAVTTCLAYALGRLLFCTYGHCPQIGYQLLQCVGVGILLWATLAKQGWSLQTWGGNSQAEKLDQWVFCILYLIGSFVLVLSVSWPVG